MKKAMAAITVSLFLASLLSMAFVTPAKAQYLVDPYTVALWHFDEGTGTTVFDETTNNNDGTVYGAAWVPGKFGMALSFDGVNDYVSVPDNTVLDLTQGTWEAWVKFDAKPSEVGHPMNPLAKANQYWIHAADGIDDPSAPGILERVDSIQAKITISGTRYIVSTPANFIEKDVWYHVAGTYDGLELKLYVNGELTDTVAVSGTIDSGTVILAVGTWSYLVDYFKGIIDEVRISNVARGPVDIDPNTLNLKSKGSWITGYIEVPGWTELFKDDFESYFLGTSAPGPWTIVGGGTWGVEDDVGNKVYSAEISSYFALAYAGDMAWTDFIYQAKVKKIPGLLSPPSERYPDIFFRYQDFNNFYYVQLRDSTGTWAPNQLGLYARKAGGWQTIKIVSATIDPNIWYTVKIAISGTSIKVYLSGGAYSSETLMIDATDSVSPLTNGAIGVGAWQSHAHFDNVVVTSHVSEVKLSTVELYVGMTPISAETDSKYNFVTDMYSYIADVDMDGTLERMVKFDKSAVTSLLSSHVGEEVSLTMSGQYLDGAWFYLSYTVRVIKPGK